MADPVEKVARGRQFTLMGAQDDRRSRNISPTTIIPGGSRKSFREYGMKLLAPQRLPYQRRRGGAGHEGRKHHINDAIVEMTVQCDGRRLDELQFDIRTFGHEVGNAVPQRSGRYARIETEGERARPAGRNSRRIGHLTIDDVRSEEHTYELQSLMRISYAVFCLKKK